MNTTYRLVKGPDHIIWCPLQPLYDDLVAVQNSENTTPEAADRLHTVIDFLSHLIIEGQLQESQE